jgi:magnesium chelatase accessory protein
MPFPQMPKDWPHRSFARRIASPPHHWCVIDQGSGPVVLLLHGSGGSGHSFRQLIPLLTPFYRVIVPDLPGHGFTRTGRRGRLGLDEMAVDLSALCLAEGWKPAAIIGHSAGGAIALRMAEMGKIPVGCVIGVNAALGEFEGAAGVLFPLMARVLAMLPLLPTMISRLWGTPAKVDALLAGTGSKIEADGRRQYLHLVQDAGHIEGTLGMMAQWQLVGLLSRLPAIAIPVLLIASAGDRAVPASVSDRAAKRLKNAEVVVLPELGHLAHEEAADTVTAVLLPWLERQISPNPPSSDT